MRDIPDLSAAGMSDRQAQIAQEDLELQLGRRCHGCGRRIEQGLHFTSVDVRDAARPTLQMAACSRADCGFALEIRAGATWAEVVDLLWLDELGADAPPAEQIVKRNGARKGNGDG